MFEADKQCTVPQIETSNRFETSGILSGSASGEVTSIT